MPNLAPNLIHSTALTHTLILETVKVIVLNSILSDVVLFIDYLYGGLKFYHR